MGGCVSMHNDNNVDSFVVGVSGGIDSAVSSTLAVKTGKPTYAYGYATESKDRSGDTL